MTLANKVRRFLADTVAAGPWALAGLGLAVARDLMVYGLTLEQAFPARAAMAGVIAGSGGPFGLWSDYLRDRMGVSEESGYLRRGLVDAAANGSFYMPLSALALLCSGADAEKIALASGVSLAASAAIGPPYRWFMDSVREHFGVTREK